MKEKVGRCRDGWIEGRKEINQFPGATVNSVRMLAAKPEDLS